MFVPYNAHVLMFGLVCSCTHVWAGMLMYMYPCLCSVFSIIVFCVISSISLPPISCDFIQYANILTVPYNLMYSCLGWYAHVLMFGLVCSCTHVWAGMLMYSCLCWYAHVQYNVWAVWAGMLMYPCLYAHVWGWYVLMFGLVCSCTHVWAGMLMYSISCDFIQYANILHCLG